MGSRGLGNEEEQSARGMDRHLLLALFLSLLAALPLLVGPGMVNTRAGGDSPFLLQRVHQLTRSLEDGVFPARWMPDGAYGLGYPAFNFYAAFPYHLAALLNMAGLGVLWGIKATQALGFLVAGGAMYALARWMGASRWGAVLGSAAYTCAPFHLVNVYVRGDSLSEFYAMALYPLIIWALLKLRRDLSARSVAFLAASYALLVLSHNISALIFSPLIALWLLAESLDRRRPAGGRYLALGAAGIGLGLALSAWFWGPALRERTLVQLEEQTTGYFHYAGHFRGWDLVQLCVLHDYRVGEEGDPFSMGLAQAALALTGLACLAARLARRRPVPLSHSIAAVALVGYTWLITPSSRWVWDHVPLLEYAQFPWRLLSAQGFALALVAAPLADGLRGRLRSVVGASLAAVLTVAGLAGLRVDRLPVLEGDISPERLMLYETYSGNIGTTIRHEYLPRETTPRPYTSGVQLHGGAKPAPLALEGTLQRAHLLSSTIGQEEWDLEVSARALLAFHTTFYPGWEAVVDGRPQGVEPLLGLGLVGLRLEPGAHRVRLYLGDTPVRRYANWASLCALIAWVVLALWPGFSSRPYRRRALGLVGALALLAVWIAVVPPCEAAPSVRGPLVMDLARSPYLHREPDGLAFGEAHLLDYSLSATEARAGEALRLSLVWKEPRPELQVRVRLLGATAHLFEPAPEWQRVSAPLAAREQELALPLPAEIPPGLYILRLDVLKGERELTIRTLRGIGLERLALEPVQVVGARMARGDEPVLAHYGPELSPPVIALVGASATRDGRMLEVALTWRSERQAPLNYWLSLRVKRAEGEQLVARDLPPLLGGYPTSLWRPGELIADRVLLPLSEDAGPSEDLHLEVILYDRLTLRAIGATTLPLGVLYSSPFDAILCFAFAPGRGAGHARLCACSSLPEDLSAPVRRQLAPGWPHAWGQTHRKEAVHCVPMS